MTVRFVPDSEGIRRVALSREVDALCLSHAKSIKAEAEQSGGEYGITGPYGKKRIHYNVWTKDIKAVTSNAANDVLARAIAKYD